MEARDPVEATGLEGQSSLDSTVFRPGARPSPASSPVRADTHHDGEVSPLANDVVARSLSDLIDDWHRKGHNLSYDDVTRVSTKRDLDGMQLAELLEGLRHASIELTGIDADVPTPALAAAEDVDPEATSSYANRDDLGVYLAAIGRHRLLFAEDEVRLGKTHSEPA